MRDGVKAIVLCEDLQGWVFVRRMLMGLGYESRDIRVVTYPADGRGCGEQHVRESYPDELSRHRSRAARMQTVLAVHVDADRLTVQERHATLDGELQKRGVARRAPEEKVAVLVPKREIETWIHFFLDGVPVDEQPNYPKYSHESDTWPAAESFARHVRAGTAPAGAPPSLPVGLAEARRLP
jgi:hypothetical protein